ncbi:replicative DNA helicase [Candidatus Mycoplasma mahonii]|uniref:replicative DNA helicase n=1 Tax=Candidatus Mycoplasma mahonii TaxID=3004105 RepID=UPI0026EEB0E3|nr:replicative DNA helicase [Candidatus Mycoplasma mahonii]WKX02709.1 replicative DNA helicase [Candidatus Mycoplasma mahonii]
MDNHKVLEIERALLGLLLIDNRSVNNTMNYLEPSDFFDQNNKAVYEAILDVKNKGMKIEVATILSSLKQKKALDKIGGANYISSLMNDAGLHANLSKFIKEITDKAQLRKVESVIKGLSSEVSKSNASTESILEKVEQDIFSTTRKVQTREFQHTNIIIKDALDNLEKKAVHEGPTGIASDYASLDKMTSGFQNGDLIIIAARPSMGKTAFALNLAANIAKRSIVGFFSLEMPSEQLINRLISFGSYINGNKIREPHLLNETEWSKIHAASDQIKEMDLYIDDSPGLKLSELVWKTKKLAETKGLDIIFIDYLQLLTVASSRSENRQAEVSVISRTLKKLARELEIPIIALSQLSRKVESRENKRPMMSDIRESGAIEQDADIITFIHRPVYYEDDKGKGQTFHDSEVIIAKHRNGPIGNVKLKFNPKIGLFTDTLDGAK